MENLFRNSAWLYDLDNRDIVNDDIPFYIEYARKQQGTVLELGCGTGRVAMTLAAEGFDVTGLDLSKDMLDVFRKKLAGQPEINNKITLHHGNMADFCFPDSFGMIIAPFRAFQALTNDADIENCLRCVRQHLNDGGIFIVNVFNPYGVLDESWCYPETVQWERHDDASGHHVVKKHWGDKIDVTNQIIYPHFAYEITHPDGRRERVVDDLKLKYYYYGQLREVIEKADMKIREEFSWYDKSPIGGREIIFICEV